MIETIPNHANVTRVEFYPKFSAICTVGKAPFWGTVHITYEPTAGGALLEFESVEKFLKTLNNQSLVIEEVARVVFDELAGVLGDIPIRVKVSARTTVHAPASAEVSKIPE